MRKEKLSKNKQIAKVQKEITEKEYFESKQFYEHLVSMFKFMTRCKKEAKIEICDLNNDFTAATNGTLIMLNWNSPLQKGLPTFKLKVTSVHGMFYHEIGHMLYTDFSTNNMYMNNMEKMGMITVNVANMLQAEKDDVECFLKTNPEYKNYIITSYHDINNIIEDIWMENKICNEFEGTVKNSIGVNRIRIVEDCPTLKSMIDDGYSDIAITINLILTYASSGTIINPHNFLSEHVGILENAKPYINDGITTDDVWRRIMASTNIFLCMWQMIKSEIKEKEEEENKKEQNNGSGNESPANEEGQTNGQGKTKSQIKKSVAEQLTEKQKSETLSYSEENKNANTSKYYRGSTSKEEAVNGEKNASESNDSNNEAEIPATRKIQEMVKNRIENAPRFKETEGSADGNLEQGGSINFEDLEFTTNDGIGAKIANSIHSYAKEIVEQKLLEANEKELAEEIKEVPFTDNHKGVNFIIRRHKSISERDVRNYNNLKDVQKYSKALQKALEQTLKRKPNDICRRQWIGKGLDKNNLYNRQKKVFYKRSIPAESNLAVSILIDESGSMSGRKIVEAVRMAVIIEDFCRNFNIPLSIAGHNWSRCVEYDVYKDFDEIDGKDKYRLMQIDSKSCNRDGAALQFCGEHLLKRPEDKKLLILISDGQPNADEYRGVKAKEDLKAIKRNLRKRGVELFAAAIDDDKEYIKAIYGDGFLDMSDLSKLPKTMVRLIENYMDY